MTRKEALAEMARGEKITHWLFAKNEWMTLKGNRILFEDGVLCCPSTFWSDRRGKNFQDGYSFFDKSKNK
jgi:hypothetical protein